MLYILLPGKKIFVSAYHPLKVLEALELSGAYYFRVAINTKQIEMVPDKNRCQNIDNKSYDDSVKLKRTVIDLEYSLNGHGPELDLSKLSLACQITLQININY